MPLVLGLFVVFSFLWYLGGVIHARPTMNVAVTVRPDDMVTVHVAPETESQPVQPVKSESARGAADSVICESLNYPTVRAALTVSGHHRHPA